MNTLFCLVASVTSDGPNRFFTSGAAVAPARALARSACGLLHGVPPLQESKGEVGFGPPLPPTELDLYIGNMDM